MNRIQLKALPPTVKNAKFESGGDKPLVDFAGVAAEYDVEIERWFGIMSLAPGCFSNTLSPAEKIVVLAHHYGDTPIGKCVSFRDGPSALDVEFQINPNIQAGAEMISNLQHTIIAGLSVGFNTVKQEEVKVGEGMRAYSVTRVLEAELSEISLVVWPAIDGARVKQQSIPVDAELSEDERHPGARSALERIIAGGVMV